MPRIDALDPTAIGIREHFVPAMREGLTHALTVAQIRGRDAELGLLAERSDAAGVPFTPAGGITAIEVQAALVQLAGLIFADTTFAKGMSISINALDANNDVDISTGVVASQNGKLISLAGPFTKRLDAAWAAGSGNGGMDNGAAKVAGATYHYYAILNPTTGVSDATYSLGYPAPTVLPAGFTDYRRRGSVILTAGGNLRHFRQYGKTHFRAPNVSDAAVGAGPQTLVAMSVPNGIRVRVRGYAQMNSGSSLVGQILVAPGDDATLEKEVLQAYDSNDTYTSAAEFEEFTNTARQIYWRNAGIVTAVSIHSRGWEDFLLLEGL